MNRNFITLLSVLTCLLICGKVQAQTSYFNSFKTNDVTGIVLGGQAKLTSGSEDPVNEGYLRLTSSQQNQNGYAYIDNAFPAGQGIKVEFEFSIWGGNMADGLTFFLFDPYQGFGGGQYGGALGYAQNNNNGSGPGMKNGFLAVGLDEYGNFGAATETKNGGFKNASGIVYTSPITANGLVAVRGGVGPNGEREGPTAYPFIGGKITDGVFGGTAAPWPSDILPASDRFGIATTARGPLETSASHRKIRLDIKRIPGTGFEINVEVFAGSRGRWIKVLENFVYNVPDERVPSTLKAGFSASTGYQYNNHEIRNVLITPSAAVLQAPQAVADNETTSLNLAKTITPLTNDNAIINAGTFQPGTLDLDPSTVVIESSRTVAGKGTFTVDNAGVVTFTPQNGFLGTAAVDYNFKDSYGMLSNTAAITVTVVNSSLPPIVDVIAKNGNEDTPLPFTALDFTSKFTDPENDALNKIKITSLPTNGTLKLSGVDIAINQEIPTAQLANITFVPNPNWNGNTTFNWNGFDGTSYATADAVVNITIVPVNDVPLVSIISKTGTEDTPLPFTAAEFTSKFTDPENDALNKIKITTLPANGILKLSGINIAINQEIPGSQLADITFVPGIDWNGNTAFNWNGSDGTSFAPADAAVNITVTPVSDAPVVAVITKTGTEDTPLPFAAADFTSKFTDLENDVLNKIKFSSLPANGTLKLSGINISVNQEIPAAQLANITFVPSSDWNGSTTFNWNGSDGSGYAIADAAVNITITAVDDAPLVTAIIKTGTEDTPLPFSATDFTSKFADAENGALSKIKITSLPANGTLKLGGINIILNQEIPAAQLANITFVPNIDWNGSTTFNWNGSDGTNYASADAAVNITIDPVSDTPTVAVIVKSGTEDTPLPFASIDFTSKFTDPENDALNKIKITALPLNGTLKLSGADIVLNQEIPAAQLANITFVPVINWNGSTAFSWNGSDGTSYATTDAAVNITITAVDDAPSVAVIAKSGTEDTPLPFTSADFASKFTDPENGSLIKIKITSLPANGILKLSGTNIIVNQEIPASQLSDITFVPNADWNGSTTFNWNASDGTSYAAADAAVNITIAPVSDAPFAVDDSQEVERNKPTEILVLENDTADGTTIDKASILIELNPSHGTISVSPTGIVTYTPNNGFIGTDSFAYKVKDANGTWSNVATVSLNVKGFIMSNVFTPNGDGKNDTFVIVGLNNYDNADLTVFNRWGNEVYRNNSYTNNWEGLGLNGGTYYFIVKLRKGNNEDVRKGWVLLKR